MVIEKTEDTNIQRLIDKLKGFKNNTKVVFMLGSLHAEPSFVQALCGIGRLSLGKTAKFQKMSLCQCHTNAEKLAIKYPNRYQRETGYALSKDGLWRPHSWAWSIKQGKIVETTVPRVLYFGFTQEISSREREEFRKETA